MPVVNGWPSSVTAPETLAALGPEQPRTIVRSEMASVSIAPQRPSKKDFIEGLVSTAYSVLSTQYTVTIVHRLTVPHLRQSSRFSATARAESAIRRMVDVLGDEVNRTVGHNEL